MGPGTDHEDGPRAAIQLPSYVVDWPILEVIHLHDLMISFGKLLHGPLQRGARLISCGVAAGGATRLSDPFVQGNKRVLARSRFYSPVIVAAFFRLERTQGINEIAFRQRMQPGRERAPSVGDKSVEIDKGVDVRLLHDVVHGKHRAPASGDLSGQPHSDDRPVSLEQVGEGVAVASRCLAHQIAV
jgi:hypothetical protein